MAFEVIEDVQAAIFSRQQVRDMITVRKGTLLTPIDIQYTNWGETYTTYQSSAWTQPVSLIIYTHFGPTPFMKALKDVG